MGHRPRRAVEAPHGGRDPGHALELLGFTVATLVLGGLRRRAGRAPHRAARPPARRGRRRRSRAASSCSASSRRASTRSARSPSRSTTWPRSSSSSGARSRTLNHELRRRFDELEDVKRYTENILASLTNGIVTVDLDGRVVTLNPAAEMLTGFFARRGDVGRYCTELFAQTPEIGEMLMETLANRVPIGRCARSSLKRRSGAALPVEVSTAPLKGGEGKDLGVVAVLRDLTLVRELEGRLRRSDRLAALGSLAAGLAHEIKNPLTSVLTFSRHVARRFDDPHFRERFQRVVPRELERINGILERLLELARPAPATFTPHPPRRARGSRRRPLRERDREPAGAGGARLRARPAAGRRRRGVALSRHHQRRRQRARRDAAAAAGWGCAWRGQARTRASGCRAPRSEPPGRDRGQRHGQRASARKKRTALQPVLHHEGARHRASASP